ncbi:TubC N-terminal docking domain-related protein [Bradyrhizobium sp. USDA 3364]
MDSDTLLAVLRSRKVNLWVEGSRLKLDAPVGAIDAELKSELVDQKDKIIALLQAAGSTDRGSEQSASGSLRTIRREVAAPVPVGPERMARFVEALRNASFDLASCAKRLGVFPRLGVNFWASMRPDWVVRPDDLIDNLISLFIDGDRVSVDLIANRASANFVDVALDMGLVQLAGGALQANVCLFPCYGNYIATDQAAKNAAINQVMWLWGESYILGGLVKRVPRRRAIDLGTGSGIHAILAAEHCTSVVGADINPRALAFASFNAMLNGKSNTRFILSDLFKSIDGTCDLLLANPPYAPDSAAQPGDNFWSGGLQGTDLLRQIVESLPARLDRDGTAHLIALYPNPPGTGIRDHFDMWLSGKVADWDVLDHTWPVPNYEDLFSVRPYQGDKSAWRFGVVSLRRSASGNGWWKEVAGRGLFFAADGSCNLVADHDGS